MKKVLSLLIAIVLCFGLFACTAKTEQPAAPGSSTPPSQPATTPATNAPATNTPATNAPATSSTPPPVASVPQGYITDDVDHYARKTYKIAFLTSDFTKLHQGWFNGLKAFEKRLNIEVSNMSASTNQETFISNIELAITQGFDGVLIAGMFEIAERATEMLYEADMPWICFINVFVDKDKQTVAPTVVLDQVEAGRKAMQWLIDNYKSFMGNIDTKKLGAISVGFIVSADHSMRAEGHKAAWEKAFPSQPFFLQDTASAGYTGPDVISAQSAYELVGAIVSTHPEIEYWLVTGTAEFYGSGAARALEGLGFTTKNALVCVVGSSPNIADWESMTPDTPSVNVACLFISDILYAAPALSGLIAIIDGRVTYDQLWLHETPANYRFGNKFGVWECPTQIITRENYKAIVAEVDALAMA